MSERRAPLRLVAVLPSRGHDQLLQGALTALADQDRAVDEIVVVDDSNDGSLVLEAGVSVLRSGGVGPYAARNLAWRTVPADVYLFVDARSRPRRTWAGAVSAQLEDAGTGIVGTQTVVVEGGTTAQRAAALEQPFEISSYVDHPWFMPYVPTCNLAIRRADLERVDGFSEVRSGGDADLCWRAQLAGSRLDVVRSPEMDWVPRTRVQDYLEQHHRYGISNYELRASWADRGAPGAQVLSVPELARFAGLLVLRTAWALVRGRRIRLLWQLVDLGRLATRLGAFRVHRRQRATTRRARTRPAAPSGRSR